MWAPDDHSGVLGRKQGQCGEPCKGAEVLKLYLVGPLSSGHLHYVNVLFFMLAVRPGNIRTVYIGRVAI